MCASSSRQTGGTILVVDDERDTRTYFHAALSKGGFDVIEAESHRECFRLLGEGQANISAVLLDVMLPELSGLDILKHICELPSPPPTVLVTGYSSVQDAVAALKLGAFDYLVKPDDTSRNVDKFIGVMKNAVAFGRANREIERLNGELAEHYRYENIIGDSPRMQRVYTLMRQVSQSDISVLIQGESGTGKELIAKAIHYNSARSKAPFVPVNCGAIPDTLIESELFGHERGAFTGAISQKKGKFELARDGTIFLDEIGDMSPEAQTRLLRVLQERTFERVGGTESIEANVRVIAASNKDLQHEVEKGTVRLDLYYRISVFPVHLPALRERAEDIPLLAAHFLHLYAKEVRKRVTGFEPSAITALGQHSWPGNVRELQNVIHRAVIVAGGPTIRLADLPPELARLGMSQIHLGHNAVLIEDPATNDIRPLSDVERDVIKRALEVTGGNFTEAARKLGIGRATLYRKVKEYELEASRRSADLLDEMSLPESHGA